MPCIWRSLIVSPISLPNFTGKIPMIWQRAIRGDGTGMNTAREEMTMMQIAIVKLLFATAAAMLVAPFAHAQPPEPFFARKTVIIYVGYTAGGSYDLYSRLIARHLGKHIPGNPSIATDPRRRQHEGGELRLSGRTPGTAPRSA